jgi:regulator of cell morphogenesis and NO signaling
MISLDKSISEIVRENYRTAEVFSRHGISYCCGGNVSLKTACENARLDHNNLVNELEQAIKPIRIPGNTPFQSWNLAFMIDFIINVHHAYSKDMLPRLETSLISFYDGHRKKYPETEKVIDIVQKIETTLSAEMKQEEDILFPYIKQLEFIDQRNEPYGSLFVKTLSKPIHKLDKTHSSLNTNLDNLRELTQEFKFPEKACTRMQVIYNQMRELHDDVIQHKHMENSYLFPAATEIENRLLKQ